MTKPKPRARPAAKAQRPAPAKKKAAPPPPEPPKVRQHRGRDWEAIERDYRTDKFTLRELGEKHDIDHAQIARQIAKDRKTDPTRWQKDLTDLVRKATNARVMEQLVTKAVTNGQHEVTSTVLAAAEMGAQVILRHQRDTLKTRDVALRMLEELEATTLSADKLEALFDAVSQELSGPAALAFAQQVRDFMRLHSRIASVQKIAVTLKETQGMERQSFNLDEHGKGGPSDYDAELEEVLAKAEGRG